MSFKLIASFVLYRTRHCEVRSNPREAEQPCKFTLQAEDCLVPRNDEM
jgi:hypothetical protein